MMKFYDCTPAPSPRRTRIFMAEKGIEVENIQVDLGNREQLGDAYKKINPRCTVPTLVLEDGTTLTENLAMSVYLEEMYPEPPLMGRNPQEKAAVMEWNARCEAEGMLAVAEAFRNSAKGFVDRATTGPNNYAQIPELAERGRARASAFLPVLNERLEGREFIATNEFTMADITGLIFADFAGWIKLPLDDMPNVKRWHEAVSSRPSASA